MIEFGNWLSYSAMGLGNHDFDDNIDGLAPFAQSVTFPLLAANINDTGAPQLHDLYKKSVVLIVKGVRVGIIGYITRTTEYNFPGREVTFLDEVTSVRQEAQLLHADGVNVIIALGHSGYDIDQKLAEQVELLDIVVGGHSHTFLYTPTGDEDTPPEEPEGPYPTYVENLKQPGKIIPVVQAKAFTKYLGHLKLKFDEQGELLTPVPEQGVIYAKPLLMDKTVEQDQTTLEMMTKWQDQLSEYKEVVGSTLVVVKDEESDSVESNMGNLIADSMAAAHDDTYIAFMNNGGIRNRFEIGNITLEDIFFVLPFNNTVDLMAMPGRSLLSAVERAASRLDPQQPDKYPGFGLQVAGLRLEILVTSNNTDSRVNRIQVRVGNSEEDWEDLVPDKTYRVAVGSYLAPDGQQRYVRGIFDDLDGLEHYPGSTLDSDAMASWVKKQSPLNISVEGRISITYSNGAHQLIGSLTLCLLLLAGLQQL
jgi:5'-nucleotidase